MKHPPSEPRPSTKPASKNRRGITLLLWRGFWLSFLIASLAYAWYCFYTPSNSSVAWTSDFSEAQERSIQSDKPMILFFTATWCVPCRIMKRTVWADEQVASKVNERFIPVMVYADDSAMANVFSRYQVGATPATIITDSQGNALKWELGKMEKTDFLEWIDL